MTDREASRFWDHIDEMAKNAPDYPYSHRKVKIMNKDKRIPEGPYFVTADDAEDCPDHAHSGLAKVDTGRSGDWPIARLCEWPTAHLIASIPEMQETIADQHTLIAGLVRLLQEAGGMLKLLDPWTKYKPITEWLGKRDAAIAQANAAIGAVEGRKG